MKKPWFTSAMTGSMVYSRSRSFGRRTFKRKYPAYRRSYPGYARPSSMPAFRDQTVKIQMSLNTNVTSSAGGVIAGAYPVMDPSSSVAFASAAAIYDLYRVLRVRVRLDPLFPDNQLAVGGAAYGQPLYACFDPATVTVPAAYNDIIGHQNYKVCEMSRPSYYNIMPGTQYSSNVATGVSTSVHQYKGKLWLDASQASNYTVATFKIFSSSNVATTRLWVLTFDYFCEFTSRT